MRLRTKDGHWVTGCQEWSGIFSFSADEQDARDYTASQCAQLMAIARRYGHYRLYPVG